MQRNGWDGLPLHRGSGTHSAILMRSWLNRAEKGVSEGIVVKTALEELAGQDHQLLLGVDAAACKDMLRRTGAVGSRCIILPT